jgi:hypothetical protein
MVTSINLNMPNIWPQQATSVFAQQTTGISVNITNLINLILPVMVVGMMMRMMAGMTSTPKRVTATTIESNPPSHEQASATTATAG